MRRRRTIYFNDARHYYLFVFEPPMRLEEARRPVDECAGTAVDTFVYGVARDDGLFYPSKVGKVFKYGTLDPGVTEFNLAAYWRLWHNMQSLIERGLDPLTVLIDRAHEKRMDFIASLRLGGRATSTCPSACRKEEGVSRKAHYASTSSRSCGSWRTTTRPTGSNWILPRHRAAVPRCCGRRMCRLTPTR